MNQPDDIFWFHGKISREEGDKLLLEDPRKINGLFIVRECSSTPNDFVLSVLCNDQVNNYQIRRYQTGDIFSIDKCKSLHGLESLIEYYKLNPLSDDGLMLTEYVRGHQPPHETRRAGNTNLLHRATKEGNYPVAAAILNSNYSGTMAKNAEGETTAHIAVINGQDDILRKLISHGVNLNLRDAAGVTPLYYACKYNRPATVRLLVTDGKADIQARSTDSFEVPLHVAAGEGHINVVETLLSLGAPANPRTKAGFVPAQLAQNNGHIECANILKNYVPPKPKISQKDFYHGTLQRQEAEAKMKSFCTQSGVYLVRYSERNRADILSLFHEKVFNYIIRIQGEYLFIDDGPLWNSLEHLVEYYSTISDGLPTILTVPVPPPAKPDAPPIWTLKKARLKVVRPKLKVPSSGEEELYGVGPGLEVFQNITFTSNVHLPNNNNNDHHLDEESLFPQERLVSGKKIGEGEFATVFEGRFIKRCGREVRVAIKTLRDEQLENNRENFCREAKVMINLNHPNIVKLWGICEGPPMQMIQELVPLGSILDYIKTHKNDIKPNYEFKIWAAQIACGMSYLETCSLVHRDLAARNVLLASKLVAKISDFGLSRALENDHEYYRARVGGKWPLKWYAPESYNKGEFDHRSDVWSFGVTIWEMYSFGETPYGDMKGSEAIVQINKGVRLERPEACPEDVYDMILSCWKMDKKERPTFQALAQYFESDSRTIIKKKGHSTFWLSCGVHKGEPPANNSSAEAWIRPIHTRRCDRRTRTPAYAEKRLQLPYYRCNSDQTQPHKRRRSIE